MKRTPESYLPLKDLEMQLMLAVHQEPLHGYALFTRVAEQSRGFTVPGPTSLYRTLGQLTAEGLMTNVAAPASEERDDPRRRYYTLTPLGRAVLSAELSRLATLLQEARRMKLRFEEGRA
jgi:DNA-binding PadR family transcriptional regulator